MDVMAMCSSPPISNQSVPRKIPEAVSTVQNLPSPPTVNEKKNRSSLPLLTSILRSPVSPLHEFNPTPLPPKPRHDNVNFHQSHQSFTPQSNPSQMNYLQSPESISQSIAQRSNLTSPSLSSPYSSPNDTTSSMWSPPLSTNSYYHQSLHPPPPLQYPYIPQSQQQSTRLINNHPRPSVTTSNVSDYLPPYATSISYGSDDDGYDNDSPYIQQTVEQSLVKMGKVVDYCNQIVHFALQYRDMKTNYNPWNGATTPQITESHLANVINRAYDVLNIVSSLKSEITARPHSIELSQDEIDLIRKHRTLGTKYRKRNRAAPPKRCHSCNVSETPEWRRGPDGARTLCNACGLHFAKMARNRTLSAMQQTDQQQSSSSSTNITLTTSPVPENNDVIEIIDD
ncbi:uncharacterized protein OCT59_014656 [Rhizophagus irregularis]|nr:Gat2p [Rhizophagus irregularis DAOM 197198w]PKY30966.1 hypothetical protein RhiirB3_487829 [Rhizophagus irregularis]PKY31541.1 hypothetical protein RhiirB3_489322 [Rhizophagus irregularis]UZO22291.1 hypothetical protein OCT59_014656 [Rhizophagus irregularis]CAG8726768.1 7827_t:CDS:2 [Rhizophagus irregularis]